MEWALLEARAGQRAAARRLFQRGGDLPVPHEPLLEAWADFEESAGCRCPPVPPRIPYFWQCQYATARATAHSRLGGCASYVPLLSKRCILHFQVKTPFATKFPSGMVLDYKDGRAGTHASFRADISGWRGKKSQLGHAQAGRCDVDHSIGVQGAGAAAAGQAGCRRGGGPSQRQGSSPRLRCRHKHPAPAPQGPPPSRPQAPAQACAGAWQPLSDAACSQ